MSLEDIAKAKWESGLSYARQQHQQWYELLPEWTMYGEQEFKYLKVNIGFAIFGPPIKENVELTCRLDNDISEVIFYSKEQQEMITKVYEKICELGDGYHSKKAICYGLVYNLLIPTLTDTVKEEKRNKGKEQNEEAKLAFTPIFKIRKQRSQKVGSKFRSAMLLMPKDAGYETWYIDVYSRVYKSWDDYKNHNTLSQCTMILPRDGMYQPDLQYPVTADNSVVWLEIQDSPSCKLIHRLCNAADIGSNVVSAVGLTVGVASMFTPIGPIVAGLGVASAGASGAWTFGRCTQNLVDRSQHEESIGLNNREAFGSWLGVAGSAFGLAATGSTVFLTKTVEAGKQVGKVSKVVCNTVIGGNLVVNTVGVGFKGFCLYKKYTTEDTVSTMDIALFTTHLLFFGNAVMNFQSAGDIIKSAQGKVIDDYRANIQNRRLRKAFNRVVRKAANNKIDTFDENAEVIQYINHRKKFTANPRTSTATVNQSILTYDNGFIKVNNIALLDPREVAAKLILAGICASASQGRDPQNIDEQPDSDLVVCLKTIVSDFLKQHFPNRQASSDLGMPTEDDFTETLNEMSHEKFATECLKIIFNIMSGLMNRSDELKNHIVDGVRFMWLYAKFNLNDISSTSKGSSDDSLRNILKQIVAILDILMPSLFSAFELYINTKIG